MNKHIYYLIYPLVPINNWILLSLAFNGGLTNRIDRKYLTLQLYSDAAHLPAVSRTSDSLPSVSCLPMSLGWQAEVRRAISNWRYWCANWIFASVSAKSTKLHAPKSHFGLEDHNTTGVGGKFLARSRFRMRHSSLALLSLKLERNANYLVVEWILIPLQQQIECILSQDPKL